MLVIVLFDSCYDVGCVLMLLVIKSALITLYGLLLLQKLFSVREQR